jgi:hypothetical protein
VLLSFYLKYKNMEIILFDAFNNKKRPLESSLIVLLVLSIFLFVSGSYNAFGIQLFSKNNEPFGISQIDWLSQYWNWWVSISITEVEDIKGHGGCLINKTGSVVMVAELTLGKVNPVLECDISSKQAIFVPLWIAWCDSGNDADYKIDRPAKTWAECARERYNTGHIKSEAKVDGSYVAKMDVYSLPDKSQNKILYLDNVTEIYGNTTDFTLKLPENNHKVLKAGTFVAGSHGWFIFLKPLSPGKHELEYTNTVQPIGGVTGTINEAAIKYIFNVK